MKKKLLTLFALGFGIFSFGQSKVSGLITLQNNMTADFTLNNTTGVVTLILTGPSDRWFAIGLGVVSGFGMNAGDVLVYTTTGSPLLNDRNYVSFMTPAIDVSQDWTTVSDNVVGTVRTLNLTRNLTTTDTAGQDFQMPYLTTNSFSIVGVRAGSASFSVVGGHPTVLVTDFKTATFTVLGVEDFSLNASTVYPNPSSGSFMVQTKTNLDTIDIYSQSGQFVKTINVSDKSSKVEVQVKDLSTGIYLIELKNDSEKSWKKVIVE